MTSQAGLFAAAYVLGSIPTGYWLGLAWKGVDVRQQGSGNLGATNVFRVLGPKPGILTFTIDCLKGLVPVLIAKHLFPSDLPAHIVTGLAAILGHTLSIFVRFRGGKGMATATGVFAALLPWPAAIAFSVFLTVSWVTRYVSLGSLLGALTLTLCAFLFSTPPLLTWTTVLVAALAVWTHRANIRRLLQGTENRLSW